jgi:hypothetical protein
MSLGHSSLFKPEGFHTCGIAYFCWESGTLLGRCWDVEDHSAVPCSQSRPRSSNASLASSDASRRFAPEEMPDLNSDDGISAERRAELIASKDEMLVLQMHESYHSLNRVRL